MTIAEQFPWAKEGHKAWVYKHNSWGTPSMQEVTITKVTSARVTVQHTAPNYERVFYCPKHRDVLKVLGGDWYSSPDLISYSDPKVAQTLEQRRKAKIVTAAHGACSDFTSARTVENARKAIIALADFVAEQEQEQEKE